MTLLRSNMPKHPPMHGTLMSSLVGHALTPFIPNYTCSNYSLTARHVHGHVNTHISIPQVLTCSPGRNAIAQVLFSLENVVKLRWNISNNIKDIRVHNNAHGLVHNIK